MNKNALLLLATLIAGLFWYVIMSLDADTGRRADSITGVEGELSDEKADLWGLRGEASRSSIAETQTSENAGSVAVYDIATGLVCDEGTWAFARDSRDEGPLNPISLVSQSGRLELMVGSWTVESLTDTWHVLTEQIDVKEGVLSVALADRKRSRTVRVTDSWGQPIESASVEWMSCGVSQYLDEPNVVSGQTDQSGVAKITGFGLFTGELRVSSSKHKPVQTRISGEPTGTIEVSLGLRLDAEERTVQLKDTVEAQVIVGLPVLIKGKLIGTTNAEGQVSIPDWWDGQSMIEFSLDGISYMANILPDEFGDAQVDVHTPVPGVLEVVGGNASVICSYETTRPSAEGSTAYVLRRLPDALELDSRGRAEFSLPRDTELKMTIIGDDGAGCVSEFRTGVRDWSNRMVLAKEGALEVVVVDHRLVPIPGVKVIGKAGAFGGYEQVAKTTNVKGVAVLANADELSQIEVQVAESRSRIFRPFRSAGGRGGKLVCRVEEGAVLTVRCLGAGGDPLHGETIEIRPVHRNGVNYPERHGGVPADHPAWTDCGMGLVSASSDGEGLVSRSVPLGSYTVEAVARRGLTEVLPLEPRRTVDVYRDVVVELHRKGSRSVTISILNQHSGSAVSGFTVLDENGGHLFKSKSGTWAGLLPTDGFTGLVVSEAGSGQIHLEPGGEPAFLRVMLGSESGVLFRLPGAMSGKIGSKLEYEILVRAENGLRGIYLGSANISVDGTGRIYIPEYLGDAFIKIPKQKIGGYGVELLEVLHAIDDGGDLLLVGTGSD